MARRRRVIAWAVPIPTVFGSALAAVGVRGDALRYTLVGVLLAAFLFWVAVYALAFVVKPSRDLIDVHLWSIGLGLFVGSGISVLLSNLLVSDS